MCHITRGYYSKIWMICRYDIECRMAMGWYYSKMDDTIKKCIIRMLQGWYWWYPNWWLWPGFPLLPHFSTSTAAPTLADRAASLAASTLQSSKDRFASGCSGNRRWMKWAFSESWGYPQASISRWDFPLPSSYWATPILGNPQNGWNGHAKFSTVCISPKTNGFWNCAK